MAIYQPLMYVPPGLLIQLAGSPWPGLMLGRTGLEAVSLLLLGLAVWACWVPARRFAGLLGLLTATTPMVIFLSSTLNPSSTEVAASACCLTGGLTVLRESGRGRAGWVALVVGAAVLAVSRPLGPLWVTAAAAGLLVAGGPGNALRTVRRKPVASAFAVGLIGLATASSIAWAIAYQPRSTGTLAATLQSIRPAVRDVPGLLQQQIGVFGWLDVVQPRLLYYLWGGLAAGLGGIAFWLGSPRTKAALAASMVAWALAMVAIPAALLYPTGSGGQGRYLLPAGVFTLLICGEILFRHFDRLPWRLGQWLVVGVPTLTGLLQFAALYVNSHRYAVGGGKWFFLISPEWAPPMGWLPWLGLGLLGAASLSLSGILGYRQSAPVASSVSLAGGTR